MWPVTGGLGICHGSPFWRNREIWNFFLPLQPPRHAPTQPLRLVHMISALHWIRRGVAAQHPEKYDLDDKEYQRISALAASQLQDAKADLADALGTDGYFFFFLLGFAFPFLCECMYVEHFMCNSVSYLDRLQVTKNQLMRLFCLCCLITQLVVFQSGAYQCDACRQRIGRI